MPLRAIFASISSLRPDERRLSHPFMAPTTFHLIATTESADELAQAVRQGDAREKPLFVGRVHHWIHQPALPTRILTGGGGEVLRWNYLVVTMSKNLPSAIQNTQRHWSITAEVADEVLNSFAATHTARLNTRVPALPAGWSASNHAGLDSALPPPDIDTSLAVQSYAMGTKLSVNKPVELRDFVRDFGAAHQGPVCMFNLLSYMPDQRQRYFQYMAAFSESVGPRYGGEAMLLGLGVHNWSTRDVEHQSGQPPGGGGAGGWEDVGLIWYPSIWHYAKMLDDPDFIEADRQYKQGVLRDNPILCCTEVQI